MGVNRDAAPPVGSVSRFRSAAGQPAVRKARIIMTVKDRDTVRSCNPSGRGRDLWRGRASRDQSPTSVDGLQHAKNARPHLPQFGAALTARAGLGSIHP
jgi:hypothetical protein